MKKEKKIIIIGNKGMLGSDLSDLLTFENIDFKGYDINDCDITKYNDIYKLINGDEKVTNIINCAAYTNVDGCEDNIDQALDVNGKAVENLVKICKEKEIHLTHISSDYVFDGEKKEPYMEQDATNPLSVYGKSKLAGEWSVSQLGDKGLIIRSSWLYGKNGNNFVEAIIKKLETKEEIKVVKDQIGSPTYTVDLAKIIFILSTNYKWGLFHVVNSGYCSWYKFAVWIAKFLGYDSNQIQKITTEEFERKATRPKYSVLATKRLEKTIPDLLRNWRLALQQYLIDTKRKVKIK